MIDALDSTDIWGFLLKLAPALINILLGIYVLIRFPRRYITDIFALLLFTSASWQLALALMHISANSGSALFWEVALSPLWIYTAPLTFHFSLLLTNKFDAHKRRISYISYLVTFMLAPVFIIGKTGVHYTASPGLQEQLSLYATILIAIWMQGLLLISFFILLAQLLKAPKKSNLFYRLLLICSGFAAVIITSVITDVIIPIITGTEAMSFTSFAMLLFTVASFIALKKYALFQGEEMVDKETLLSSVSDLIIAVNNGSEITYINKPALEKLGYDERELLGKDLKTIIAESCPSYDSFDKVLANTFTSKHELECIFKNKEGKFISVMVSVGPIQSNSKSAGSLIIAKDTSALKSAFETIRTSEKKFRQIVENSKDGTLFIDSAGKIAYASPPVKSILGYTKEELISKSFWDFLHPDSKRYTEGILTLIKASPIDGVAGPYYVQVYKKDGTLIWLECNGKNELSDEDINAIVVVFRDVTDKYMLQLEQEQTIALFTSLIQNIKNGALITTTDRQIITANKELCDIFRLPYDPNEIAGHHTSEFMKSFTAVLKQPEQFDKRIQTIIAEEKTITGETIEFNDGRIYERDFIPIRSHDKTLGILWMYRDVTERENYQEDLLQKNLALQKLNREMDMFMYSVSHDIRSPVASILGLTGLADTEIKDTKASGYIDMIRKAAGKLDKYTKEIIHYSENIKNPILPEPIELGKVVESVIAEIERNYKFAEVDIELDVFDNPQIVIDNARLQVILKHLLLNAVQYQRINEPNKYVKLAAELTEGWLNILVADNGEGIEENKLNEIFDLFTRFSYRSKGSGIGLYMVKEILNKLDGEISVTSIKGQGTTFRFSVPCLSLKQVPVELLDELGNDGNGKK